MASYRKRYNNLNNGDGDKEAPPVATAPRGTTAPPAIDDAPKPEPKPVDDAPADPVKDAEQNALRNQLRQMEQAERLSAQPQQQPQDESPQAPQDPLEAFLEGLPEPTQKFLRAHPEYMQDAEKNAALQHFHHVARRETGEEFTERYVQSLERHLGLRQQPQPTNGNQRPVQSTAQRQSAPLRHSGPPVSAPPTREAPSMSTGRPPTGPTQLTSEELQLAQTMGLSPQEYAEGKKGCYARSKLGCTMDEEDKPFVIESPTRIRLSPLAKEMAKMHGMTEIEMAKHLLNQHALKQSGLTQGEGES